ncbi:hypothetical protein Celaphus_00011382, partial [Cervus elaphus hippelaphus]
MFFSVTKSRKKHSDRGTAKASCKSPAKSILLKVAETIKSWILAQSNKNDDLLHKLQGILLKVAETIKSWILAQSNKNDDLLHKLDTGFRLDSLHTILQQEVLLQEDVELIELLDPSILSAGQPQQQENGHLPTLCSLATPNIWYCPENIYPLDVSVVFAFISLLVMLPTWWIVSSWL